MDRAEMRSRKHVLALLAAALFICNGPSVHAQEFHLGLRHLAQANGTTGGGGGGGGGGGAAGGPRNITGGNGNDTITGGPGNDIIRGGRGNDTLNGNAGDQGQDIISGGPGADTLEGGFGNDSLDIGPSGADDTATGGPGLDTITVDGAETCSEPCIPTDDELGARHPSCVATDCVHTDGGSRCVVVGPRLCQGSGTSDASPGPQNSQIAPMASPAPLSGFISDLSTKGCGLELYPTCCQGGLRGLCAESGECGVSEDTTEECELGNELNELVPGSSPEIIEDISAGCGIRRGVSALIPWALVPVVWYGMNV